MALFLRPIIVDDSGIENIIRQEAAMGVESSKAIPKAFWLALLLVGLMTHYSDLRPRRMARAEASPIETKISSTRLAQGTLPDSERETAHR
jgi:hypothetical protein